MKKNMIFPHFDIDRVGFKLLSLVLMYFYIIKDMNITDRDGINY